MGEEVWDLIDALDAWQVEHGLNNTQMAARLDVPRSTWATYRLRKYRPGLTFVQKVSQAYGFAAMARPYLHGVKGAD